MLYIKDVLIHMHALSPRFPFDPFIPGSPIDPRTPVSPVQRYLQLQ